MAKVRIVLLLMLTLLTASFLGMGVACAVDVDMTIENGNHFLNAIQITEKQIGDIQPGQLITVSLPAGTSYATSPSRAAAAGKPAYYNIPTQVEKGSGKALVLNGLQPGDVTIDASSTAQTLVLKIVKRSYAANPAVINVSFSSQLTHKDPRLGLIIDGDSHVSIPDGTAEYIVHIQYGSDPEKIDAHTLPAGTFVYTSSCPKVTSGEQKLGSIRIVENIEGALIPDGNEGAGSITLTLPKGIKWNSVGAQASGGFTSIGNVSIDTDRYGQSRATFTITSAATGNAGIIDFSPTVNISANTAVGDIFVAIGGTNAHITPANLVIGRFSNAGITGALTGQAVIYAGCADAPIGTLVLRENGPGSLIEGRVLYVQLPQGCKWVSIPRAVTTRGSCTLSGNGILSGSNGQIAAYTVVTSSSDGVEGEIEFRNGSVSVPVGFPTGDFNISFGGTAF